MAQSPLIRTLVWWAVLVGGLACASYLISQDKQSATEYPEDVHSSPLLQDGTRQLTEIVLFDNGIATRVVRGDLGWAYVPEDASGTAATDSRFIEERLAMLNVAMVERRFAAPESQYVEFGFEPPVKRIELSFVGGSLPHLSMIVGKRTPDGFGQYLLLREPGEVVTLPAYHVDNLVRIAARR